MKITTRLLCKIVLVTVWSSIGQHVAWGFNTWGHRSGSSNPGLQGSQWVGSKKRNFSPLVAVLPAKYHGNKCPCCSTKRRSISKAASLTMNVVDKEESTGPTKKQVSKRVRFLNMLGIKKLPEQKKKLRVHEAEDGTTKTASPEQKPVQVTTLEELENYFSDIDGRFRKRQKENDRDTGLYTPSKSIRKSSSQNENWKEIDYDSLLATLSVLGDTQIIGSPDHPDFVHPVLQLLHERRRTQSKPTEGTRPDGFRVALAIEGGGMRGCISAGMVAAIHYLGLSDAFDVVYGSSAGTVIGSYFITRQLPLFGPEIYYDSLTTAGKAFIDTRRLLRAVGLGLLDPRLMKDVVVRPHYGKPVLNLSFLLKDNVQNRKRLDWEKFVEMQKVQPLKIVASGLRSERAVVMDMERGSFRTIDELTDCMHASCLLPGIAGPVMNLNMHEDQKREHDTAMQQQKHIIGNNIEDERFEPLADALIYEPFPYRSAVKEGATHVVVLRTRPDGVDVTGKSSIFERLIIRRFFVRKNKLRNIYKRMRMHLHKKRYAEDVIILNEAARNNRNYRDTTSPHLMPIAVPPGSPEITRLETDRKAIFEGVRRGFARAYDALVEDPTQRGRGEMVAKECFPEEIMDYNPLEISSKHTSAFQSYVEQRKDAGLSYEGPPSLRMTTSDTGSAR